MDIHAIESFCDRWVDKAQAYRSDELEDLFDRFFTLFVAYNRFYSTAADLYRGTRDPKEAPMLQGDRREATTIMSRLIGPRRFSDVVQERPEIAGSCETISELLHNRQFFLHSTRGTKAPDLLRDAKLADDLRRYALLAVLECLYQIRCNIFHGEKEFAPRQARLLVPAITLLECIVQLSRDALREIASQHRGLDGR
ncbi:MULTISPECIES: hypothetical protein [Ralstonia solanacearum species complex]|uniref:Apea-like HEPN domain-containing protein n=1 Tax=Ralstonia solanacearum IPO1609 TaxID=564066 RepID=A0A7U7JCU1_RALSL|nr:hypothetical protein [Ralstonia solanacearum]ATI29102.1 hypothetical protein CCY86_16290 [Ralstonia solanacearum]ATJ87873.1 hypothetical protein CDC59_16200 [Ralstonia solanacearum]KEI31626.1 hypothetical protein CQ06_21660 [Ralstonia solanacearum]KFX78488.1 hypothetical protein KR98_13530 [Ralstonia solanacearum]KFX81334.1 hypothetical protein KR99_23955 [Ralstonia solanacearum]